MRFTRNQSIVLIKIYIIPLMKSYSEKTHGENRKLIFCCSFICVIMIPGAFRIFLIDFIQNALTLSLPFRNLSSEL